MENDVFKTNPVFQNLSPEKLSFLMNFANSKKPTEMKDMMPFLLGTLSSAKKQIRGIISPGTYLDWLQKEYLKKNSPIVFRRIYKEWDSK